VSLKYINDKLTLQTQSVIYMHIDSILDFPH